MSFFGGVLLPQFLQMANSMFATQPTSASSGAGGAPTNTAAGQPAPSPPGNSLFPPGMQSPSFGMGAPQYGFGGMASSPSANPMQLGFLSSLGAHAMDGSAPNGQPFSQNNLFSPWVNGAHYGMPMPSFSSLYGVAA